MSAASIVSCLLSCSGASRSGPSTAADVLARAHLRPTPDVAVFVDGKRCRNDTLDRVHISEVRGIETLRDSAAMLELGPDYRLIVRISTAAAPRVVRAPSRNAAAPLGAACEAGALTDANYTKPIPILDAPNGTKRFEIRNDSASDEIWTLTLHEHARGHFRASVVTSKSGGDGWIAERYVGIFARNYSSHPLTLYTAPDTSSPVQSAVDEPWSDLYSVTGCAGRWLQVRATIDGKTKQGWMPPTMQCDNPYTTCN